MVVADVETKRQVVAAVRKLNSLKRAECFDPANYESRPTVLQSQILQDISKFIHRWVIAGNQSGKSMTAAREGVWIFTNTHPTFEYPESWKGKPLTMIIVGRTLTQVYEELWCVKMRPFLDESEYKEEKVGGVVSKVVHKKTGNKILFFSHHSPREAREKIQSFTAHWLWLDEMPDSLKLIEELHRRCQAHQGRFLATFTPKLRNVEIKKMVENTTPYQKTYKMGMLDNPIYRGREEEILAPLSELPSDWRNTILSGDWYTGDSAVYKFFTEIHVDFPVGYSPLWRHIESVDPASSGKAGHIVIAEDPSTGVWYVVLANYIDGASARSLLNSMDTARGQVNLIRRISDPHENWFIKHCADDNITFDGVFKKTERKKELIKNLQKSLDSGKLKIPPHQDKLIDEFTSCQYSETVEGKIVGSRRFHLLDALQYAIDELPERLKTQPTTSVGAWIRQANKQRLAKQASLQQARKQFGPRKRRHG